MKNLIVLATLLVANTSLFADAVVSDFSETGFRAAVAAGGTITFAGDGTILLNSQIVIDKPTIIDATGRNITINGNAVTRLFEVNEAVDATFKGLKLINGMHHPAQATEGGGLPAFGGAILFHSGLLRLESCVFSNNVAWGGMGSSFPGSPQGSASGGAIYADSGYIIVADCTFVTNRSLGFERTGDGAPSGTGGSAYGGAIAIGEGNNLDVDRSEFIENQARGGIGWGQGAGGVGYGGAVHLPFCGANLQNATFRGNNAHGGESVNGATGMGQGGAIWSGNIGVIYMFDSNISSNSATAASALAAGGGIYSRNTLYVQSSSINRNTARAGKGRVIQNTSGAGYDALGAGVFTAGLSGFTNVTFLLNAAYAGDAAEPVLGTQGSAGGGYGGGIYNISFMHLAYVTMALNQVVPGQRISGAVGTLKGSDVFTAVSANSYARSSIFGSVLSKSISGPLSDGGYNITADDSAAFTQTTSFNSRDPLLGPVRATYIPILPGSPAIDSADFDPPFSDQLGLLRPAGTRADRGAIEYREIRMGQISLEGASVRVRVINNSGFSFRLEHSTDAQSWTDTGREGFGAVYEFLIPRSSQAGVAEFWRAVFTLPQ